MALLEKDLAKLGEPQSPLWDAPTLAAWDALLDSFDDGEAEDHRDTVATLA
jgi:hypothetical protein